MRVLARVILRRNHVSVRAAPEALEDVVAGAAALDRDGAQLLAPRILGCSHKTIEILQRLGDFLFGITAGLVDALEAHAHADGKLAISTSLEARVATSLQVEEVEATRNIELLGFISGAVVHPDTRIVDVCAKEVGAKVHLVRTGAKGRQECAVARHAARLFVNSDRGILSALPQIGQVQHHQRVLVARRKREFVESCMLRDGHLRLNASLELEGKETRRRLDRVVDIVSLAVANAKGAAVEVVAGADLRKDGEVAQARVATGATIVDAGKASDVAAVSAKAACILAVDIGNGFGETIRESRAREDVSAVLRADEGVDVLEHIAWLLATGDGRQ